MSAVCTCVQELVRVCACNSDCVSQGHRITLPPTGKSMASSVLVFVPVRV